MIRKWLLPSPPNKNKQKKNRIPNKKIAKAKLDLFSRTAPRKNINLETCELKDGTRHVTSRKAWKSFGTLGSPRLERRRVYRSGLDRSIARTGGDPVAAGGARARPATEEHGRVYKRALNREPTVTIIAHDAKATHQRPPPETSWKSVRRTWRKEKGRRQKPAARGQGVPWETSDRIGR